MTDRPNGGRPAAIRLDQAGLPPVTSWRLARGSAPRATFRTGGTRSPRSTAAPWAGPRPGSPNRGSVSGSARSSPCWARPLRSHPIGGRERFDWTAGRKLRAVHGLLRCRRLFGHGARPGRGSASNAFPRPFRVRHGEPVARAQALRAARMRKARRPQLGRYTEGSAVVLPADRAAALGDQFRVLAEPDDRAKRRDRPFTVQRHDVVGRRHGRAGSEIQSRRLRPPDPRHLIPALVASCRPHCALGSGKVQVL